MGTVMRCLTFVRHAFRLVLLASGVAGAQEMGPFKSERLSFLDTLLRAPADASAGWRTLFGREAPHLAPFLAARDLIVNPASLPRLLSAARVRPVRVRLGREPFEILLQVAWKDSSHVRVHFLKDVMGSKGPQEGLAFEGKSSELAKFSEHDLYRKLALFLEIPALPLEVREVRSLDDYRLKRELYFFLAGWKKHHDVPATLEGACEVLGRFTRVSRQTFNRGERQLCGEVATRVPAESEWEPLSTPLPERLNSSRGAALNLSIQRSLLREFLAGLRRVEDPRGKPGSAFLAQLEVKSRTVTSLELLADFSADIDQERAQERLQAWKTESRLQNQLPEEKASLNALIEIWDACLAVLAEEPLAASEGNIALQAEFRRQRGRTEQILNQL